MNYELHTLFMVPAELFVSMISCNVQEIVSYLKLHTNNHDNSNCDNIDQVSFKCIQQIKHMRSGDMKLYMTKLIGQKNIENDDSIYSVYKINISNEQVEITNNINSISHNPNKNYQITIYYNNNHIFMHTFAIEFLSNYLKNQKSRHIMIPIILKPSLNANINNNLISSHCGAIIIDKQFKRIYLYDPNGHTLYFNRLFATIKTKLLLSLKNQKSSNIWHQKYLQMKNIENDDEKNINIYNQLKELDKYDGCKLVDMLIEKYVYELNQIDEKYTFVSSDIWNPTNAALNKKFTNILIGSGHCISITFMVFHYILMTKKSFEDVWLEITQLADNDMAILINAYSNIMYNIKMSNMNTLCREIEENKPLGFCLRNEKWPSLSSSKILKSRKKFNL